MMKKTKTQFKKELNLELANSIKRVRVELITILKNSQIDYKNMSDNNIELKAILRRLFMNEVSRIGPPLGPGRGFFNRLRW